MKIEELEEGEYETFIEWLRSKIKVKYKGTLRYVAEVTLLLVQNIILLVMFASLMLAGVALMLGNLQFVSAMIIVFILCCLIMGYSDLRLKYKSDMERKAKAIRDDKTKKRASAELARLTALIAQRTRNPPRKRNKYQSRKKQLGK